MADAGLLVVVATDEGLYLLEPWGSAREDSARDPERPTRADDLAGKKVLALERGDTGWWAIVGGRELWHSADGRAWARAAAVPRRKATCLACTPSGLLVGTTGAHLLRLDGERLAEVRAFDDVEGRTEWHTPWGAPADVRSMSAASDRRIYVNVHVGGVARSTDGGDTWRPTLDIDHDVHQVLAPAARPGLVLVAAYDGFGVSEDGGDTWRWENDGLREHYCRAVAVAGETVYLSASAGHHGRRAALYRRRLDGGEAFERCRDGLPEWFADNVDTGCLAARGDVVAMGTEDGCVYLSADAGERWKLAAERLAPVRAIAVLDTSGGRR